MIHWDHNAGSPLLPGVAERLGPWLSELWGNPGSVHATGRSARARLDEARTRVAASLSATSSRELVFTGSGSEAAALALVGAWLARSDRSRRKIVSTEIEHPCVQGALDRLAILGAEVLRVPPSANGAVDADRVVRALDHDVFLCSVMWANNETGVLQPIAPIAKACQDRGIVFHTDAVQAVGKIALGLDAVPIDLLSLSAHKLGGPAGVGVLYNRRAVDVAALTPGHQENGRRGGTPSVAFALATAEALEHALANQVAYARRLEPLRDRFEAEVSRRFGAIVNGAGAPRVPNTANVTFPGLDGEALLIALDLDGIAASTGAACASGSLSPSQVLLAMGLEAARARSTLRFSLGPEATDDEVSTVLGALERHVDACRMGPTR